ncbi:hypothetical protein [Cedecea lapagei]|uniref:hypothetical protein n=1 Tax=Cedecea lapagei TaxID=158823 RepID=UPI0013E0210A|nr:hypothetical protein [Cedecea lapagei]
MAMGSSEVMDLAHANAIPLKKQQQTPGKRGMKGGGQTPLFTGEERPGNAARASKKIS